MEKYSWPRAIYDSNIPRELVHAVGAIVIAWNWCEEAQVSLLRRLLHHDHRVMARILEPMGNAYRSNLLVGLLAELMLPDHIDSRFRFFAKAFNICLANRNLVVHSLYVDEVNGTLIQNSKAQPNIQSRYLPDEAEFWEQIISEMQTITQFGFDLDDALNLDSPPPEAWPEIPQPPRDLTTFLPIHKV